MERSKIKTIVIVLLLLLNLFFIALNLGQKRAEAASARAVEESVVQILRHHGIRLDGQSVPWHSALQSYTQPRTRYDDRTFAEGLVGEIVREEAGTTWTYVGAYGTAEFSQGGAFEVRYETAHPLAGPSQEEALAFLERLGIQAQGDPFRTTEQSLVFLQTQDGLPLFTCDITFTFEGGVLTSIHGRRLTGPLEPGGESIRTAATLLTSFAQAKAEGRITCGEIITITEGYINQGLTPVWRILSETGVVYLDCVTGEIRFA